MKSWMSYTAYPYKGLFWCAFVSTALHHSAREPWLALTTSIWAIAFAVAGWMPRKGE